MSNLHQQLADASQVAWPVVLDHLWQATLFCALAFIFCLFLRKGSACIRHSIWLLVLVKCALPATFLGWLVSSANLHLPWGRPGASLPLEVAATEGSLVYNVVAGALLTGFRSVPHSSSSIGHSELYCLLTAVWLVGVMGSIARYRRRRCDVREWFRQGRKVRVGMESDVLRQARVRLKEKREVDLVVSPLCVEPGVWGVCNPVIVLPEGVADGLSNGELEAVLMHELVHVRRRDNLIAAFQIIVRSVLWFFPVVWLVDRQLLLERERACDEEVLLHTDASKDYLSSLMKVLQFSLGWRVNGVSLAAGSDLKRRIDYMKSIDCRFNVSSWHRLLVAGMVLLFFFSLAGSALVGQQTLSREKRDVVNLQAGLDRRKEMSVKNQTAPASGIAAGVPGGVAGGVAGGVLGGVKGGVPSGIRREVVRATDPIAIQPKRDDSNPQVMVAVNQPVQDTQSQAGSAGLEGTIRDASQATVPGAVVIVTQLHEGTKEIVISDDAGRYGFRELPAGMSLFEVRKSGFRAFQKQYLIPASGEKQTLDITLEVGEVTQTLEVVGQAPPKTPAPGARRSPPQRIRVGGNVRATKLVHQVNPVYPEELQQKGIQGVVLMEVIISKDGSVGAIRVLNKLIDPGLVESATEAVKQWYYEPTLLNGQPIEVVTTITVNFKLAGG